MTAKTGRLRAPSPPSEPRPPLRAVVAESVGALLTVLTAAASLFVGAKAIPPATVIAVLTGGDHGNDGILVLEQRLPRMLLALGVGIALAAAGVLMHTVTRNPLADPGLFGITSGATLAVVIGGAAFGAQDPALRLTLAMFGALAVSAPLGWLALRGGSLGAPLTLTLVGIAISAVCQGLVLALSLLRPMAFDLTRSWNVGSVADRGMSAVLLLAPLCAIGLMLALILTRSLEALSLGETTARALGVRPNRVMLVTLVAIVLLTAVATAVSGPIAFAGLLAVHLARPFAGGRLAPLLTLSCIAGALLMIAADVAGRLIIWPAELAVGVVVALIGAPALIGVSRMRIGATQ